MSAKGNIFLLSLSLMVFGLSGCGDSDSVPESTTSLTPEQAQAIGDELSSVLIEFQSLGQDSKLSPRSQGSGTSSRTFNCEGGGSITVDTEYDVEQADESAIKVSFSSEQTYNDCKVDSEGQEIVLESGSLETNGDIHFTITGEGENREVSGAMTVSTQGGIDVSGDEIESGTCGVDLNFSLNVDSGEVSFEMTGSICGEFIDLGSAQI